MGQKIKQSYSYKTFSKVHVSWVSLSPKQSQRTDWLRAYVFSVKANICVTLYPYDLACLFHFQFNGSHFWCHSLLPLLMILNYLNLCGSLPVFAAVYLPISHIHDWNLWPFWTTIITTIGWFAHNCSSSSSSCKLSPHYKLQGQLWQHSLRSF